jgi:hypothetical protein
MTVLVSAIKASSEGLGGGRGWDLAAGLCSKNTTPLKVHFNIVKGECKKKTLPKKGQCVLCR